MDCVIVTGHPDTVKMLLRSSQPKAGGGGNYDLVRSWTGKRLAITKGFLLNVLNTSNVLTVTCLHWCHWH